MSQQSLNFALQSPIARRKDPASSHQAAEEITQSGLRTSQLEKVLELVRRYPGQTSRELALLGGMDRYVTARRLPELRKEGHVKQGPIRECRCGNKAAVTWWSMETN